MTTLRLETRTSLKWCLEQRGHFTAPQLQTFIGKSQTVANMHLRKFLELGVVERTGKCNKWVYSICDREEAQELAFEALHPRNGYVLKANRPVNVWKGSNSVFGAIRA